jgi:hypothetical protein
MDIMKRFSVPLVIITALLILMLSELNIPESYDPPLLQSVLNTLFSGKLLLIVALFAARVYFKINTINYLYMFCAMLISALGAILAGWLRFLPNGRNAFEVVFNTRKRYPEQDPSAKPFSRIWGSTKFNSFVVCPINSSLMYPVNLMQLSFTSPNLSFACRFVRKIQQAR